MTSRKFWRQATQIALMLALLVFLGTAPAKADVLLASQTNCYAVGSNACGVQIDSSVWQSTTDFDVSASGDYIWKYHVINTNYDPNPGTSNGFAGFELALPGGFPPDLHDPTDPASGWVHNCCSGEAYEWDITNSGGSGIMPGGFRDFSFESAPRVIGTARDGWFHSWAGNVQTTTTPYSASNAPLAPNLVLPPVPEPSGLILLGTCVLAIGLLRLRRGGKLITQK